MADTKSAECVKGCTAILTIKLKMFTKANSESATLFSKDFSCDLAAS